MNAESDKPATKPTEPWMKWAQTCILIGVWLLAQWVTRAFGWPVPGSILGLIALWVALDCGLIRLGWIEHGADGLLNHLMLFFVPAMLALVDHPEFFSLLGVKLLLAVIVSTLIVMCGTAGVVELSFRLKHASHR